MEKKLRFNSATIHGGQSPDKAYGAVMPPIYQTSTYAQSTPGGHQGYEYSRTHNPTRSALERSIASIENGKHGLAFASGMAAMDTVLKLFNPGDEIISTNDLYGGSYRLFTKIFEKYGLKIHFVNMDKPEMVAQHLNDKTRLIWIETPTNPMMNVVDIRAIAALGKANNTLVAVDNTFSSPYLQQPLDFGADIVMHSATKYLAGHSDTVLGLLVVNDDALEEQLAFIQNSTGAVPGPMDCFLTLRGIKTLHLRMERHSENGAEVAAFLQQHSKIEKVYWPGFTDHPNHDIAKTQMKAFGGMLSFIPKGGDLKSAIKIVEHLKIFTLAESLGGVESLAGHPASMTHASIPKEIREKSGVVDGLIRLSVGIEDVQDLIEDLDQAIG
ncbi:MAG: Cystathionine beta-lyase [Flavobacteriaceae bacterium]|jgi:cystathionine beta-lyase/cystathionine gamma-synthase|nr:cystathionine gamma-synthase [Flavobacteriaceae bacterium]CAI8234800.1 MAG: Cystathionine beta-lyase [Flavobacteriaceae bacterium]HCZ09480.1 cystathionine gamma-synthase [Flavobacteriaceae bacterium]|tara:strand:+ start:610 stop:1761 length:1152 start_codon:yes stop_codon:yes gene_type:complete